MSFSRYMFTLVFIQPRAKKTHPPRYIVYGYTLSLYSYSPDNNTNWTQSCKERLWLIGVLREGELNWTVCEPTDVHFVLICCGGCDPRLWLLINNCCQPVCVLHYVTAPPVSSSSLVSFYVLCCFLCVFFHLFLCYFVQIKVIRFLIGFVAVGF